MEFKNMNLSARTIAALNELGYVTATEVQEKTILPVMSGKEVVVRSQTGTGKTASFGIGLVEMIAKDKSKKAMVLAPTRELALQITKELRSIAEHHRFRVYAIYGGQGMGPQISLLRNGFDIVVATPGRLLDHARRGTIDLSSINCVVLDEADTMLDMGFKEDIDTILDQLSPQKQMMLFSATIDGRIKSLARQYMNDPEIIEVGPIGRVEKIDEEKIHLSRSEKAAKLKNILTQEPYSRVIIFVATKHAVEKVCHKLVLEGMDARYIHGGKSQTQRERVMRDFKEGEFRILVATDVAARGLHIEDVSHIINYDEANTAETHTHRVGRTGRMGKGGKAITFVETDPLPKVDYRSKRSSSGGGRGGYGGGGGRGGSYGGGRGGYGGADRSRADDRSEGGYGARRGDDRRGSGRFHARRRRPY